MTIPIRQRILDLYRASQTDIGRTIFIVVSAAIISAVFAHHSVLHGVERWTFDLLARLDPPTPRGVVVVDIDDGSYEALFDATSPLNAQMLERLIDAVAQGKPRAIGIDIDTSSRRFAGLKPRDVWPPVVWASGLRPVAADAPEPGAFRSGEYAMTLSQPLGGAQVNAASADAPIFGGIPIVLADDADRRVRRYRQLMRVGGAELPSFARVVAERSGAPLPAADTRARLIRYAPSEARLRIPAGDALALGATEGWRSPAGPVHGKIVLIGGSYSGLDRHATPRGEMRGVEILANTVETELEGGGVVSPGWFRVFSIQIFGAVFVSLLLHLVHARGVALLIFMATLTVLSPVSSLLTYGTLDRWLYFALVYLAAAAMYVADDMRAKLSSRQDQAIRGTFEQLKGRLSARRAAAQSDDRQPESK